MILWALVSLKTTAYHANTPLVTKRSSRNPARHFHQIMNVEPCFVRRGTSLRGQNTLDTIHTFHYVHQIH